jgi:hypothetical protein
VFVAAVSRLGGGLARDPSAPVFAAVAGVAGLEFTFESWIVAATCFVVALCLWWIYFDLADTSVVGRVLAAVLGQLLHHVSGPVRQRR